MTIRFLLPTSSGERNGNVVTSERWRAFFEALGHRVVVDGEGSCDVLVAFNAYKTRRGIREASAAGTASRLVICLTGTDLYEHLPQEPEAWEVLALADRLVVLHPLAVPELPRHLRDRTDVVYQSAVPLARASRSRSTDFDVCVIAHLRDVKDPLRAARAARLLPESSRIRVLHAGRALSDDHARAAALEAVENPRYRWLGEQSRERTAELLAQSRLLVLSSSQEGGANVISEAVAAGVPVLASDIPCARGLLRDDYPGLFPVGNTGRLAELLLRAETVPGFYLELAEHCRGAAWKFEPELEREGLRALLEGLFPPGRPLPTG